MTFALVSWVEVSLAEQISVVEAVGIGAGGIGGACGIAQITSRPRLVVSNPAQPRPAYAPAAARPAYAPARSRAICATGS